MTVGERLYNLETELILNTIKHLNRGNYASAEWGLKKLSELGLYEKSNIKLIEKATKDIIPLIRAELEASQKKVIASIDDLIKADNIADVLPPTSQRIIDTLKAFENKAIGDISQTGSTMIQFLNSKYESAVNQVISDKLATGESIRETITKTAKIFKKDGVESFRDKAGRKWTIEAYSQMVVRSNARQTATQTQFDRLDEYDIDLVEISSHLGARPKCEPYQGRVYSRSGSNPNYPPFSDTSYGEIDGLFGINCGHSMYPYKEGTKKTFKPYPKKLNDKAYELSQEQRKLERNVRGSKRDLLIAKETNDKEFIRITNMKLKADRSKLKDFIEESGRTNRADRQRIY